MLSSTSNSKPGRPAGHGKVLALFSGTFLALAVAGWFLSTRLGPGHEWRGEAPDPWGKGCVVNEIDTDHFDIYDVLYYGIGPAIDNARKADVLLLGNSRVLFAFREPQVRAFCRKSGLQVFNLCFPANDGLVMAYQTILRHDLRPAVVVVNENNFFNLGRSPYGTDTVEEGYGRAWMRVRQHRFSWAFRRMLHQLFPKFGFGDLYRVKPNVTYQSVRDGCLLYENFSAGRRSYPIRWDGKSAVPTPQEFHWALKFKKFLAARGTSLVLTDIPYDEESYVREQAINTAEGALSLTPQNLKPFHKAGKLAEALGVPLAVPSLSGMRTLDGSHLDGESAERFAAGFFTRFGELSLVRRLETAKRRRAKGGTK